MADPRIEKIFKDDRFYQFSEKEQIEVMRRAVPRFSKLSGEDQVKALNVMKTKYAPIVEPDVPKVDENFQKWQKSRFGPVEPWHGVSAMKKSMSEMGKLYPAFETAANFITSGYGVPISGILGLTTLMASGGNLDEANRVVEAVQRGLVYQPKTEGGKSLTEAAQYPFQKLDEAGAYVGEKYAEAGHPMMGAAAHSLISASPAILGAKTMKRGAAGSADRVIQTGIEKGVRPSVVKKEVRSQYKKYIRNATSAVKRIIQNEKRIKLTDRDGNPVQGLPRTLDQFSQAIEQTKRLIFDEYDAAARAAGEAGVIVETRSTIPELVYIVNNKELKVFSPETVAYARKKLQSMFDKDGNPIQLTPIEAQNSIKMLNQSQAEYYAKPSMDSYGRAHVDSVIANQLRAATDAAIENATGTKYQALKREYGALRMLETDVTKRAIVDARKNNKGLLDFSDIFSGFQVVQGLFTFDPVRMGAGATAKGIATWMKLLNDPNRTVKNTFRKASKYMSKPRAKYRKSSMVGVGAGIVTGQDNELWQ